MAIVLTPARITHILVFGEATGAIGQTIVHNTHGHVTYTWTTTATAIAEHADGSAKTGLQAGKYRLVVRDEQSEASITYTVNQNRPVMIYPARIVHVDVFGQSTGQIARTTISGGSGTYTPYWSSDVMDMSQDHSLQSKQNLPAGQYHVRVIDGVGGSDEYTYNVRQSKELSIKKGSVRNATLHGRTGGVIAPSIIIGGVPPYELLWTRKHAGQEVPIELAASDLTAKRELKPGLYTLRVQDSKQAVATAQYKVGEGPDKVYFEFASTRNFYRKSD